jgi:hypothetical protein
MTPRGSRGPHGHADGVLAAQLAGGATIAVAAAAAGVSVRTAHRRLNEPAFRKLLDDLREDHLGQAGSALAREATASVVKLAQLRDGAVGESVQLRAAALVLELGLRIREAVELEQRIGELERRLAERERVDLREGLGERG